MSPLPDRPLMTLPEVADVLGLSRSGTYELAANGGLPLPVISLGRLRRVPTEAVARLIAGDAVGARARSTDIKP